MACERFRRPRLVLAMIGILVTIAITDGITNFIKVPSKSSICLSLIERGR